MARRKRKAPKGGAKAQHMYRHRQRERERERQRERNMARHEPGASRTHRQRAKPQHTMRAKGERKRERNKGGAEGSGRRAQEDPTRAGAEIAQDRQARTLQTSYEPSRSLLDRSLKEAMEGEVFSF